jgi:hypothetical protein
LIVVDIDEGESDPVDNRQRLQLALREALRARDTVATSALRSALAAAAGRPA